MSEIKAEIVEDCLKLNYRLLRLLEVEAENIANCQKLNGVIFVYANPACSNQSGLNIPAE
jgi:hypothetical protein